MAHIVAEDELITKSAGLLSEAQLCRLQQAADAGDAAAAVALCKMSKPEQSYARMLVDAFTEPAVSLVKVYGGKVKKPKKPKVTKSARRVDPGERDALKAADEVLRLAESDPAIRENMRRVARRV